MRLHRSLGFSAMMSLALLIALGGAPRVAFADGGLRSEVDARRVGLQDQVSLTITIEGSSLPDQIPMPELTNLRIVGGPATSTQMSFVNGRSSQSRSWTFALQPNAVGRAQVGAIRVQLPTGEASAPAIPIDVVSGSVKPRQSEQQPSDPSMEDPFGAFVRGRTAEPQLFVEAKPSRSSLFVGEPLLVTYYLYTRSSVTGLQFTEAPQYSGFWAEDLEHPEQPNGEPVTVGGVVYRRFPVAKKLLYPTKAGRIVIPAATLRIGLARQSFFDAGGVVERATKPVTLDVKPIPDEPGFSGAVGTFKATASVDRSSLALGEAATLRFKVEGSGNLKWIDRGPELNVPGAKVYPPQVKSALQTQATGISGTRTWEFVVVPETAGSLEIPSLAFTYFNPAAGRIVRSTTAPLPLSVSGGAPGSVAALPPARPGTAARGGPLPLRADLELGSSRGVLSGRMVGLISVAVLLFHGLLWGSEEIGRVRRRGQGRVSAPRSVRGAMGDLQRIGRDGMSKEAAAGLIEKTIHRVFGSVDGDDGERARAVRALLDDVHAVRYAPQLGDYSERLRELASRAIDVVRRWA